MEKKLEEWWDEHCEGVFALVKQAREAKISIQGKIRDAIMVDMSEIRVRDEMELVERGLSLFIPPQRPNIGYIYEEE